MRPNSSSAEFCVSVVLNHSMLREFKLTQLWISRTKPNTHSQTFSIWRVGNLHFGIERIILAVSCFIFSPKNKSTLVCFGCIKIVIEFHRMAEETKLHIVRNIVRNFNLWVPKFCYYQFRYLDSNILKSLYIYRP